MNQAIVACAIIYRKVDSNIQILLTQRALNSSFLPGVYEIPGGHIEYGEDIETGLLREIKEELDISIIVERIFSAFTYDHNNIHTAEMVYLTTMTDITQNIHFQEDEIAGYRWITENEVDSIISATKNPEDPEIKIIKNAFEVLKLK